MVEALAGELDSAFIRSTAAGMGLAETWDGIGKGRFEWTDDFSRRK